MKQQLVPRVFTLELTGAELEESRDLIDNKLTAFEMIDREDGIVSRRLRAARQKIEALGDLRARRFLVPAAQRVARAAPR